METLLNKKTWKSIKRSMKITTTTPSLLIAFALGCFALSPTVQAFVPAPDGGYPRGNTAEGQAALLSLTSGRFNTAK
jgi:hypothetical protein